MSVTRYLHVCALVKNKKARKGGNVLLVDPKWAKLIISYGRPWWTNTHWILIISQIQLLFGVTLVTNNVENRIHMKVGRKIGNY
jgi:hypothetical protein